MECAASPPLTAKNNYATKSPLVTTGCPTGPTFNPKTVPSNSTISTPPNTPIRRPTPITTPNGNRSNQPFSTIHSPDRPTDRQTDWCDSWQVSKNICLCSIVLIESYATNNCAVVTKLSLLQHNVHNYSTYKHHWPNEVLHKLFVLPYHIISTHLENRLFPLAPYMPPSWQQVNTINTQTVSILNWWISKNKAILQAN